MKKLLILLPCLFVAMLAFAQNRQVKGRVTDDADLPLQGVNVHLKGTRMIVQTNAAGEFSILVPATGKPEWSISYAGFNEVSLTAEREELSVKLVKSISTLDDVVVVGYTTVRKKDLTGATSSMSGRDIEKVPVSSVAEAMTGRLAGVQVTTTDGA